jgi:hypothetical protein
VQLEGLDKLKKSTSSRTRTGNLSGCNIAPQPTTLPRAPCHTNKQFEISKVVNKVLDNNIMGQCSLSDDSDSGDDYTQLKTPGTHTISISNSVNDGNKQRNVTYNE